MKQKIMEALLESSNPLTKEEIMWAASHLPTSEEKGKETVAHIFDHSKKDLFKALGCDQSDADKVVEVLANVTRKVATKENYNLSHGVEETIERGQDIKGFFPLIISKIIRDAIEHVQEKGNQMPDSLMKLIKLLEKKKKEFGNEEKDED